MDMAKLTQNLTELEAYLKSPRVDDDFLCGAEEDRIKMLELLEKLMDLGELADVIATRLIFRGRMPFPQPTN